MNEPDQSTLHCMGIISKLKNVSIHQMRNTAIQLKNNKNHVYLLMKKYTYIFAYATPPYINCTNFNKIEI